MTGSLFVDGHSAVDELILSPRARGPGVGPLRRPLRRRRRPRRPRPAALGGVSLDPDDRRLGPDALSLTPAELRGAGRARQAPLKARLLDQARIAGIGNLLADEILWRASLAPNRRAGSLTPAEIRRLHRHIRADPDEL